MAPTLYGLLGPLEVRDGNKAIRPPSPRQRLLLAVLMVEADSLVTTDRLAEELWGDTLPMDPAAALRTQISRLRRSLGRAASDLVTESGGYRLDLGAARLDSRTFEDLLARARDSGPEPALEHLEEALALWRGPALEEFADRPFAQPETVRLEALRVGAREQRGRLLLDLDLAHEAVGDLEALVGQHPERERGLALLMEALSRSGRQREALDVYRHRQREMTEELGLDPSPELRRMERRILEQSEFGGEPRHPDNQHASDVPFPVSSLVGREEDIASLRSILREARLVTLCGPGGVGKTRLALEVIRGLDERYPDGLRFCDLVAVRRATSVLRAIATAIGVSERGSRAIDDQLIESLGGRRMLIILDNCEHVAGPAARIADRIVRECPGVTVLVTSQVRLGIDGEHVWAVHPLDAHGVDTPATRLFLDRAQAADPSFRAEPPDEEAIASICRRLDGLPLAIELAAACMRGLSPLELEGSLDQRFRLLESEYRTDERHRSLRAVVEWSYDQLSPVERTVFERLCVFAGRFDIEAAQAVATGGSIDDDEVTRCLLRLVDRSLVSPHVAPAASRFGLLETLRAYGISRLEEKGELADLRDRHAGWAIDLAAHGAAGLAGPDELRWAEMLGSNFDELREAHSWLVGRDVESSLKLVSELHWFALLHSQPEVFRWAEMSADAAAGSRSPLLPTVLASAAAGAWLRGELEAADTTARAAAEAARGLHPIAGRGALEALADVALHKGELDRSIQLFGEAYELARQGGYVLEALWDLGSVAVALAYADRAGEATEPAMRAGALADETESPSARALAQYFLGEVAAARGSADEAEHHLRSAIELAESVGSQFIDGLAHVTLATVYAQRGDDVVALRYLERATAEWHRTARWMPFWVAMRHMVDLLSRAGAFHDAAALLGAVRSTGAVPAFGPDELMLTRVEERLRAEIGDEELDLCWQRGATLSVDEVAAIALEAARRSIDGR